MTSTYGNQPVSDIISRDTHALMQVALGQRPGDLAIVNAKVVNVYTGELLDNQTIVTSGKWIANVGRPAQGAIGDRTQVIDAGNKVVIPGLIDGHTHLALLFNMAEFVTCAAPSGTTTVVTEAFEPYAVGGCDGLTDFLDSLTDQPIKLFAVIPPMVSISPRLLGMPADDLKRLMDREDVLGMGESYWQGVLQNPDKLLPGMQQVLAAGKTLEGHSAGARDDKLAAYTAVGITSCHEPITAEEALARMRLGIHVMAREGNVRRDLAAIAQICNSGADLRRLTLVSDGVDPEALMSEGYMEALVRKAIDYGFDPIEAIRMTTLNVAEHFRIDHLVGGIAPGRYADMVLIPGLDTIEPELVISNGQVVARNGEMLVSPRRHAYRMAGINTTALPRPLTADDFVVQADKTADRVRMPVMEMVTDLVTRASELDLPVRNGRVACDPSTDLIKVAAIERRLVPGKMFTGLIKGFGLTGGAFASSLAWDTSDMIVVGADESDMAVCINRIASLQGGIVVCRDGKILAELALPVMGIICDRPMFELALALAQINDAVRQLGADFPDPLLTLQTLTGAAIPFMRICEDGLVDLKTGEIKR